MYSTNMKKKIKKCYNLQNILKTTQLAIKWILIESLNFWGDLISLRDAVGDYSKDGHLILLRLKMCIIIRNTCKNFIKP